MTTLQKCSEHLYWTEIACKDGSCYPLDWRTDPTRALALGPEFEAVRSEVSQAVERETGVHRRDGTPLIVLEGYRTQAYQDYLRTIPRYRAAARSQHVQGRALDLACPRELPFTEFAFCVERAATRTGSKIRYIELRPSMNYIHFDVRPTERLVIETAA